MKRLLSLLLTVGILFALVSCAKEEAQPAPDISTDSKVTETVTMEETFSQTQGEEEKPVENDPTSSSTPETTTTAPPVTTTTPPPTTAKAPTTTASSHSHSYVKTGSVAATCTSGGSETFTCSCGSSYVNKSYALGHLYTKWVVIQEATTTSTGTKECKCDICGGAPIYETIPVKVVIAGIDPRITVDRITNFGVSTRYSYGKCKIIDRRTWGTISEISVISEKSLHVVYYDKNNQKQEFNVSTPYDNYIAQCTIKEDGTYVIDLIGAYS